MKKIILSLAIICGSFVSNSQIVVSGISPAPIVGNYDFTWADNWGATPNFNTPGVFVQDTLMLVETGQSGTNPQGNPISQEGCAALVNVLAGKIAVIYRNTCEFGAKALNAQNAGAVGVIIINRDNDVVGMGGGASGSLITIPVVMLSSSEGLALTNEMLNGSVVVFMGNKAGLFPNDLSISINNALIAKSTGVPIQVAQNGTEFNFDLGLRVYNFGNAIQSSITVTALITNPSGAIIYNENVGPFSLNGVTGVIIDSVDIDPTASMTFPNFNESTYPVGVYTLTYSIVDANSTDDFMDDNMFSTSFRVAGDLISYAQLDVNNIPRANNYFRASDATNTYSSCIAYSNPNASRLGVDGFYFSATTNSALNPSIEGEQVSLFVYEWNNVFLNLNDPAVAIDDLLAVGSGIYTFESDLQDTAVYAPLENQFILEDNQRYLFCVQVYNDSVFLGHDTDISYEWNVGYYLEAICPVESNDAFNFNGFGADVVPSIGVKVFDAASIGLNDFASVSGTAYPNPANDQVSISVSVKGTGKLTITDVSGRTAYSGAINLNTGKADVNVSDLKTGMYIFNINFDNGQTSTFNVVKN